MVEELDIETYLRVSPNKFGIYLFDTFNKVNLYNQELELEDNLNIINLNILNNFLKDNVFEIEKLLGRFLKNIILIIDTNKIKKFCIGIKKKNYESIISKQFLENSLIDAKDLFKENYKEQKILHMIILRYFSNDKYYSFFEDILHSDNLCLEIEFRSIPEIYIDQINYILEKYQIKILEHLDGAYINNYFKNENINFTEMVFEIKNGCNLNEVKLVPKSQKNKGFFEKFFQLFS